MTHTTDQERALSSLRHLYQQMSSGMVKDSAQAKRIAEGLLSPAIAKLEQAAHNAPAAPVPQGLQQWWKLVPLASTTDMRIAYQRNRDDGFEAAYRALLAAAPQPPEAAPMQLPEPSAWMSACHTTGGGVVWKLSWTKPGVGVCHRLSGEEFEQPLFTEQQVRTLLASRMQRHPLTDSEIEAATGAKQGTALFLAAKGFTLAVERAHNITKDQP